MFFTERSILMTNEKNLKGVTAYASVKWCVDEEDKDDVSLPSKVLIPEDVFNKYIVQGDEDAVTDYLSNTYEFLVQGYDLEYSFSDERTMELLNSLVNFVQINHSISETIGILRDNDFSYMDMLGLGFDEESVRNAFYEEDD